MFRQRREHQNTVDGSVSSDFGNCFFEISLINIFRVFKNFVCHADSIASLFGAAFIKQVIRTSTNPDDSEFGHDVEGF